MTTAPSTANETTAVADKEIVTTAAAAKAGAKTAAL